MSRVSVLFWQLATWLGARRRQAAQGLVEYALILVLIAVVVVGVLSMTGFTLRDRFDDIQCKYGNAGTPAGLNCP
jgi:Flp pilus assembly pilin Flp